MLFIAITICIRMIFKSLNFLNTGSFLKKNRNHILQWFSLINKSPWGSLDLEMGKQGTSIPQWQAQACSHGGQGHDSMQLWGRGGWQDSVKRRQSGYQGCVGKGGVYKKKQPVAPQLMPHVLPPLPWLQNCPIIFVHAPFQSRCSVV